MKIGIPRSFHYYYFKDLWITFFENLNIDVVISPETNKEIIDLGLKYSTDEMCLSLKNYIGHIAYLKDKCDYILIPRIDNYGINNQTCTNFLAIYDIISNLFNIKILNYNINLRNKETELNGFIHIGKILNINKSSVIKAYKSTKEEEERVKNLNIKNNIDKLKSKKLKILLIGHQYNIQDKLIGKPIINMLNDMDVQIINSSMFPKNDEYKKYTKGLYWKYNKENMYGLKYIDKINGIIFLSSFPCGPDSLVNELVMRKINIPYINLIIDDISFNGGIETRLESFIDIVKVNN